MLGIYFSSYTILLAYFSYFSQNIKGFNYETHHGHDFRYASTYASYLLQKFREDGIYMRPLGNVIYLMCGPCTNRDTCHHLLKKVYTRIQEFGQQKEKFAAYAD